MTTTVNPGGLNIDIEGAISRGFKQSVADLKDLLQDTGEAGKEMGEKMTKAGKGKITAVFSELKGLVGEINLGVVGWGAVIYGVDRQIEKVKAQMFKVFEVGQQIEDQWITITNVLGNATAVRDWMRGLDRAVPGIKDMLGDIAIGLKDFGNVTRLNLRGAIEATLGEFGKLDQLGSTIETLKKVAFIPTAEGLQELFQTFRRLPPEALSSFRKVPMGPAYASQRMQIIMDALAKYYTGGIERIKNSFSGLNKIMESELRYFREVIIGEPVPGTLYTSVVDIYRSIVNYIEKRRPYFEAIAHGIGEFFKAVFKDTIGPFVQGVMDRLDKFFKFGQRSADGFFKEVVAPIVTYLSILRVQVQKILGAFLVGFKDGFLEVGKAFLWIGEKVWGATKAVLEWFGINTVEDWKRVAEAIGYVVGALSMLKIGSLVLGLLAGSVQSLAKPFVVLHKIIKALLNLSLVGTLKTWIAGIGISIAQFFGGLSTSLRVGGTKVAGEFLGGFFSAFGLTSKSVPVIGWLIALLETFYVSWKHNWFGMREVLATIWIDIQSLFNGIIPVFTNLRTEIQETFASISSTLTETNIIPWIKVFIGWIIEVVHVAQKYLSGILVPLFESAFGAIISTVRGAWNIVVGVLKLGWSAIEMVFKVGYDVITGNWRKLFTDLKDFARDALEGIKQIVQGAMDIIWAPIEKFDKMVRGIWDNLKAVFSGDEVAKALPPEIPLVFKPPPPIAPPEWAGDALLAPIKLAYSDSLAEFKPWENQEAGLVEPEPKPWETPEPDQKSLEDPEVSLPDFDEFARVVNGKRQPALTVEERPSQVESEITKETNFNFNAGAFQFNIQPKDPLTFARQLWPAIKQVMAEEERRAGRG